MSETSGVEPRKDPDDWTTGGEAATGPQLSYLQTLGRETGETVPANLSKADASKLIDDWQARSSRTAGASGQGTLPVEDAGEAGHNHPPDPGTTPGSG
jgi:hypothetical protein